MTVYIFLKCTTLIETKMETSFPCWRTSNLCPAAVCQRQWMDPRNLKDFISKAFQDLKNHINRKQLRFRVWLPMHNGKALNSNWASNMSEFYSLLSKAGQKCEIHVLFMFRDGSARINGWSILQLSHPILYKLLIENVPLLKRVL